MKSTILLNNIEEMVIDMQAKLIKIETTNWNQDTKNIYLRDLANQAITVTTIIRGLPDSSATYEALNSICRQANNLQVY